MEYNGSVHVFVGFDISNTEIQWAVSLMVVQSVKPIFWDILLHSRCI